MQSVHAHPARGFETGSVFGASEVDATARWVKRVPWSRHLRGIATVKRVDAESDGAIDVLTSPIPKRWFGRSRGRRRHEIAKQIVQFG